MRLLNDASLDLMEVANFRAELGRDTESRSWSHSPVAAGCSGPGWLGLFSKLLLSLVVVLMLTSTAYASDIYLAQASSGSANGADCSNARTVSGTSWAAGNTYHLCGTLTSPVTPNASGTSAAHITILFEPNAKISMPAIPNSGGIALTGRQWIDVDGGGIGIIESTNNGTNKGSRTNSVGVEVTGSNLTVHGLTFQNLYNYTCCGSDNGGIGVYAAGNNITNVRVYDNVFTAMFAGVEIQLGASTSNIEADHNTLPNSDIAWGIVLVQGYSNSSTNGTYIHDNDITPGSGSTPGSGNSWCTGPSDSNHLDPIHTWSQGSGGGMVNDYIYNNYIHGNFCVVGGTANSTAAIFWEAHVDGGSAPNTATVFNNLILMQGGHPGDGAIYSQTGTNGNIYNNTVDCTGADSESLGTEFGGGTNNYFNNIIIGCNEATLLDGGTYIGDFNDWFKIGSGGWGQQSLAQWKSSSGQDAHSITTDPKMNSDHTLQSGSPVIGMGSNLTTKNIAQLNTSKPISVGIDNMNVTGVARSATAAWDLGAYAFGGPRPNPPTNVSILSVQ